MSACFWPELQEPSANLQPAHTRRGGSQICLTRQHGPAASHLPRSARGGPECEIAAARFVNANLRAIGRRLRPCPDRVSRQTNQQNHQRCGAHGEFSREGVRRRDKTLLFVSTASVPRPYWNGAACRIRKRQAAGGINNPNEIVTQILVRRGTVRAARGWGRRRWRREGLRWGCRASPAVRRRRRACA